MLNTSLSKDVYKYSFMNILLCESMWDDCMHVWYDENDCVKM